MERKNRSFFDYLVDIFGIGITAGSMYILWQIFCYVKDAMATLD